MKELHSTKNMKVNSIGPLRHGYIDNLEHVTSTSLLLCSISM